MADFSQPAGTLWNTIPVAANFDMNTVIMYSPTGAVPFIPIESNLSLIAGVSSNSGIVGSNSLCVQAGALINGSSFTVGAYFADVDGGITHTAPTTGLILQIGYAVSADMLIVDIKQPTQISPSYSYSFAGNGTQSYGVPASLNNLILVFLDGLDRKLGRDYSYDPVTRIITFGSAIKTTQTINILYS